MALNYRIENNPQGDTVHFTGKINEDAELTFADLAKNKVANHCTFNLKEIEMINSCGVRAWINFLRLIEKGREIVLAECTPEIVSQINMIPHFKGTAKVQSLYASYICEDCDTHKLEMFTQGVNMPLSPDQKLPEVICPNCKKPMEMEELEDEFFAWVSGA
ncbi:MAG: hypothetical protein KA436_00515 [Oligoflexales bacterium]|nr:hypothetical protein [Oligoflexales bacterium]